MYEPTYSKRLDRPYELGTCVYFMGLASTLDKLKLLAPQQEGEPHKATPQHHDDADDVDEIDTESQSVLSGIIAQLRPGCDLTRITLPTFVLERKSMLERITNFFQIPELLIAANKCDNRVERFTLMLKWYLASWHIAPKGVKKPLNPVLGEVFTCYWEHLPEDSSAIYVSEQTSHHPPKSSYFYLIPNLKIRADGILIPKSKFLGNSSAAIMEGVARVTLGERDNEVYLMNQPNVYCRGILFGKLRTELGDQMYFKCPNNNLEARIEFKTKGFIGGTYDAIQGYVTDTETGEQLFEITGNWNKIMFNYDLKTKATSVFFDALKTRLAQPSVRPIEEQWDYESRKLWKPTVDALTRKDYDKATEEKSTVENGQREETRRRQQSGTTFKPKFFRLLAQNEEQQDLEYIIDQEFDLSANLEVLMQQACRRFPIFPGSSSANYPVFDH